MSFTQYGRTWKFLHEMNGAEMTEYRAAAAANPPAPTKAPVKQLTRTQIRRAERTFYERDTETIARHSAFDSNLAQMLRDDEDNQ